MVLARPFLKNLDRLRTPLCNPQATMGHASIHGGGVKWYGYLVISYCMIRTASARQPKTPAPVSQPTTLSYTTLVITIQYNMMPVFFPHAWLMQASRDTSSLQQRIVISGYI